MKDLSDQSAGCRQGGFTPLREGTTHDVAVVLGRQEMPARTEERCDYPKDRKASPGSSSVSL